MINDFIKRIIIFLVRKRLKIGKYIPFQFINQKNKDVYYIFTNDVLLKYSQIGMSMSQCSLNWLLSNECDIEIIK